ncbi:serine hydrolase [Lactobacillus taiwanensis]|uniref:serine hydrolase n=1 Tax=Lactobacillus taiwanensis TaxID=508451 RepID=UPI000B98396F|nr:serine hydrolase [Lactobacillus taiwanensis]OYS15847.1 serine hydrolase [Lactobacillus taiwanensis]OYS17531.1 serine hydrolase [Lactobacillus taiwanensis]
MKNKIFLGAILSSFCALAFYMTSINHMKTQTLEIYGNSTAKVAQKSKMKEGTKQTRITSGESELGEAAISRNSNKNLAKAIVKASSNVQGSYQVSVKNLNNPKIFADLTNTSQDNLNAGNVLKLFVLLAYYKAVQDKSLNSATPYKVKSSDLSNGDKVLKADMSYSYTYLLDLMMRQQNDNAANIILNKIGKDKVNQTTKDFGAGETEITENFGKDFSGKTSAADLVTIMKKLYQGKVLGTDIDNKILGQLANFPEKGLAKNINGTVYRIADKKQGVALVQENGKTYAMALVSEEDADLAKVGDAINDWMVKQK